MKKVLTVLLVLLMFSGCKIKPVNNDPKETDNGVSCEGKHYVELMRNYEVRDKSVASETDNEDFEQFLTDIFSEMVTSSYMNMHYLVTDYKSLGLEKPEPALGSFSYSLNTEQLEYYDGVLEDLHTFDYSKLSNRQQYDYDSLEYFCYSAMGEICFYRYDFILNERHNEIDDLISYFTDYTFYDEESVDDYVTMVKDIDRFMDEILVYVDDMAKAGYPMADEWIDYTQKICDDFRNKVEDNVMIVSFDRSIDALDFLSDQKKEEVKKENREVVLNEVLPAYKKVRDSLEKYRKKAKLEDYALYKFDKDYADFLYMKTSSSNKTVDEMFEELGDALSLIEAEFLSCYYDKDAWQAALDAVSGKVTALNLVGRDALEFLKNHTDGYLPEIGEVEYTVEELDPDVAPDTVLAYYWPNPVDNYNQNIIRTNPNNLRSGVNSFSTLAHEGIPGHMFQNVFHSKTKHNYLRRYIEFLGYAEGWAVYSSYLAFQMAKNPGEEYTEEGSSSIDYDYVPSVLFYETNDYFLEYSLIDIMTNYYGYSVDQIYNYFDENSIFVKEKNEVEMLRNFMLEMACSYTPYGIGYSEIVNIRENVIKKLNSSFDLVDFNEALLINGPMPYNILESYVYNRFGVN